MSSEYGSTGNQSPQLSVESVDFCGTKDAPIRQLSGFKKGYHRLPDGINDHTQGFVKRIAAEDLESEATQLYDEIKRNFEYKRKEIHLELECGEAHITCKDFDLMVRYMQSEKDSTSYTIEYVLNKVRDGAALENIGLQSILVNHFDELRFSLVQTIDLEDLIDSFEAEDSNTAKIDYPHHCNHFELTVSGHKWSLQATAHSVSVVSSGMVSPGIMLAYLRESQLVIGESPALRKLFGE